MWKLFTIYNNNRRVRVIFEQKSDVESFSSELAKYIKEHYEKNIVYKIFEDYGLKYSQFNKAYDMFAKLPQDKRIDLIKEDLIAYIEREDFLNIEGFILFRLQMYKKELEYSVEKSLDGIIAENEYNEFIELLKFFVDMQESSIPLIHIIYSEKKYILLDKNYNEITDECIDDFKNEMRYGIINYDDLLLSTLISLSPKSIIIHNKDNLPNKQLLSTLEKVFDNKIKYSGDISLKNINLSQIKSNLYNLD
ncbi:MAG: putative sporulation protein YtxC [Oscillospiraceae bacterium]|nr:putative sporulation protein YtxC [Oscillospiraceae bacterium]